MSLLGKHWRLKNTDKTLPLWERLLRERGVIDSAVREKFLQCDLAEGLHDPTLMHGMPEALDLIRQTVQNNGRIMIYGDYDVDGVTGTAILFKTLKFLGASASYRLPHRQRTGYGLHLNFIEECARLGVQLIITTDCGISNLKEITRAKELGLQVIVTDHHAPPEVLPPADAILNPRQKHCHYPDKHLCGAAVAFKLASALLPMDNPLLHELIELTALGIVADSALLLGEQRVLVAHGLHYLTRTRHRGLQKLKELAGLNGVLDAEDLGFILAPRLNAAGRLDDALLALHLFLDDAKAEALAHKLESLNRQRQKLTTELFQEAESLLLKNPMEKIFLASGEHWHGGVVGLVAGKLAEKYFRPTILLEERAEVLVGSCRSPEYFSVIEALQACADLFENFGGHRQAAGFTVSKKNYPELVSRLRVYAEQNIPAEKIVSELWIDAEVSDQDLAQNSFADLKKLAPFGAGNPEPLFLLRRGRVTEARGVGNGGKHLRLKVQDGRREWVGVGFNLGEFTERVRSSRQADFVFALVENFFNGRTSLEWRVVDIGVEK
jgi:single-stranded-DNA-specific exonuclease